MKGSLNLHFKRISDIIILCIDPFIEQRLKADSPIPTKNRPMDFRFDISVLTEPPMLDGPSQGWLHAVAQCGLCISHVDIFRPGITLRNEGNTFIKI